MNTPQNPGRRRLLQASLAASTLPWVAQLHAGEWQPWSPSGAPSTGSSSKSGTSPAATEAFWSQPRVVRLNNLRTNERVEEAYFKDGKVNAEGYRRICWLMRDWRQGAVAPIDLRILDLLCAMQAWVAYYGYNKPFILTSGYRTQKTNGSLEGAAKNSMHLQGKAADIVVPDLPVSYLGRLAQHYSAGGVGFYPSSGFVHVDTGRVRTWGRR